MSYKDGWLAMNLEMPPKVPRTEYSAEFHWDLVREVTGIDVNSTSDADLQARASAEFTKEWDYGMVWNVHIFCQEFGEMRTDMGHAEYATDGTDMRDTINCPFASPEEVLAFDPWEAYGERDKKELTARFERDYEAKCKANSDAVNMTGTYITLMSGLIDIFGWDMLLMAAGTDMEKFGELANRYASWMQQYFDALADADVPVAMMHDDITWTSGPFLNPAWYREYIFPNYVKYLEPLKQSGKKILFTSDGDYTMFVDDIAKLGVHGFVLEPVADMKYVAEKYGQSHVIVGNADTRILLDGTKQQIRTEVERCMDLGKSCPGFFMSVGNHIPSNTPVENAIYYNQIYNEMAVR